MAVYHVYPLCGFRQGLLFCPSELLVVDVCVGFFGLKCIVTITLFRMFTGNVIDFEYLKIGYVMF